MAKRIKPTHEDIKKIQKEFAEQLSSGKWPNGEISFKATMGSVDRKATVHFTSLAWRKMNGLIKEFGSEVGWHGVAFRDPDDDCDDYYITDIIVYPQEVTGVTVTTDQSKYQDWLMSFEDDVFNNIRMQGHSHVNMGTSPSTVDKNLYEGILEQLEDDMFYIFMIWNKKKENTSFIYDMKKNILFEKNDITVMYEGDDDYEEFMSDAKDKVRSHTETKSSITNNVKKPTNQSYSFWDPEWDNDYSYYGYGRRANYDKTGIH